MIRTVVVYQCEDGTRFNRISDAQKYDKYYNKLHFVEESLLGKRSDDVEEGLASMEHPVEKVVAYRKEICRLAGEYIPVYKKMFSECGEGIRHISHAERIVSDSDNQMLNVAFYRLSCINQETGVEYQQPFFANHPEKWEEHYNKYVKK